MVKYRHLTRNAVTDFVKDVLVKETVWGPGCYEVLTGSYVFVCSRDRRDLRCGVIGPLVVGKFKDEIDSGCLHREVSVSPCSDIGGHEKANVIIYSQNSNQEVTGHWYGYVGPNDVPELFKRHIKKGEIVEHLWRGQMGLLLEEQRKVRELRVQQKDKKEGKVATSRRSVQLAGSTYAALAVVVALGSIAVAYSFYSRR